MLENDLQLFRFPINGKQYHYAPKEDITPQECAYLFYILVAFVVPNERGYLYPLIDKYVAEHNLLRHFREIPC